MDSKTTTKKRILGISAYYHDSAAALIIDGEIISAVQEERFTRKKHDPSFPKEALKYCLKNSNLTLEDINAHHQVAKEFAGVRWENEGRGGKRWNRITSGLKEELDGTFLQVRVVGRSISGKGKAKKA